MWREFTAYIFAISRHWGPLATGVGALIVTALVEHAWPEHAPWWVWVIIIISSVFIASFMAWGEMRRERDDRQKQLDILNAPSMLMELVSIEEELLSEKGQTLFVKITNTSTAYIRPEVFAVELRCVLNGTEYIYTHPGPPESFGLNAREHHTFAVLNYKSNYPEPFQLIVPTKRNVKETMKGKEFVCKLMAYGGSRPSIMEFRFGIDDQTLWAKQDESAVIKSHVRTIAGKAADALAKELKKEG